MINQNIKKYPDAILRQKSVNVKFPLNRDLQKLITDMIENMRESNGVGLAANQIGREENICVIEESGNVYVLINPKLKSFSRELSSMEEGCLSFPDKFFNIVRPEKVKIRYLDESGKKCKLKASGLLARIVQHELDHLSGVLIIDKR